MYNVECTNDKLNAKTVPVDRPCLNRYLSLVDSIRLITPGVEDIPFANIPFFVSGFIYHQLHPHNPRAYEGDKAGLV